MNGKYYVGQTTQKPESRFRRHGNDASSSKYPFHRAIQKHGKENFVFEVIALAQSAEELNSLERLWITLTASYVPGIGYNCHYGGNSRIPNEETKRKIGDAHKGKKRSPEHIAKTAAGNTGQKRSTEQRKRMSDAHKGQKISKETILAMIEGRRVKGPWNKGTKGQGLTISWSKGKRLSLETRAKMSEAKRNVSPETRAKYSEGVRRVWAARKLAKEDKNENA